MIGLTCGAADDAADPLIRYHGRLETMLVTIRWIAVAFCLAMIALVPRVSPVAVGLAAVALALGNLALTVCLARESRPHRLTMIRKMATTLEWLAALGMILGGAADPMNPVPAVLTVLVLVDGLRYGPLGVAGASVGAQVVAGAMILRRTVVLKSLRPTVLTLRILDRGGVP